MSGIYIAVYLIIWIISSKESQLVDCPWPTNRAHFSRRCGNKSTVGPTVVRKEKNLGPSQRPWLYNEEKSCQEYQNVTTIIVRNTLQGINISHLGKRKIIFKMPFLGDMLVSWRVTTITLRNTGQGITFSYWGEPLQVWMTKRFGPEILRARKNHLVIWIHRI